MFILHNEIRTLGDMTNDVEAHAPNFINLSIPQIKHFRPYTSIFIPTYLEGKFKAWGARNYIRPKNADALYLVSVRSVHREIIMMYAFEGTIGRYPDKQVEPQTHGFNPIKKARRRSRRSVHS